MATVPVPPPAPLLSSSALSHQNSYDPVPVHLLSPNPDPYSYNPKPTPVHPSAHVSSSDPPPPPSAPPTTSPISNNSLPSSDLVSRPTLAPDLVAPDFSGAPSRSATTHQLTPLCQLVSSSSRSGAEHPAAARVSSRSEHPPPPPAPFPSLPSAPHPPAGSVARSSSNPLLPSTPLTASRSSQPLSSLPASTPPGHAAVPPRSYAQVARPPRGPGFVRSHARDVESFARLPRTGANIICGSKEGMPSFSFVNAELPMIEELYANALVMKFHGSRPSLEASHKEIQSWGMEHPFSIGPLSSRAFLLRFHDNADLLKVLTRQPSLLITCPYKIYRWHNLCHMKEDSCFVPIWISLPRLPLQCFIPEFLESVANKIGRFLCFDKATSTLARPSAARICVEIDLRRTPPPFIWVGLFEGFRQQIIYERVPKYCNQCHIIGHAAKECHRMSPTALQSSADQRAHLPHVRAPASRQHTSPHVPTSQQNSSPIAVPPPPPQSSSACHHPININPMVAPSQAQQAAALLQIAPAAAVRSTSSAPSLPPYSRTAAIASPADHELIQQIPVKQPAIPSTSSTPHHPQQSSNHAPIPCTLCLVPGHTNRDCPSGHREAISKPADPHPSSIHGCTPLVRQNVSEKSLPNSEHQHTSLPTNHDSSTTSPPPTTHFPNPHPLSVVTIAEGTPSVCHNAELPTSANNVNLVEDQQIEAIQEHPNSVAKPIKLKQLDVDQSPSLNQQQKDALERFKKKVRAQTQSQDQQLIGSTSANPFEALIEDQSDEEDDDFTATSFNSDTDDGPVEPIDMGYQSADGRSSHYHTKSSASVMKTNKRHPNIPLNVRLRARKNSYSSSHKYMCM